MKFNGRNVRIVIIVTILHIRATVRTANHAEQSWCHRLLKPGYSGFASLRVQFEAGFKEGNFRGEFEPTQILEANLPN